jgi:hypothetical protein
MYPVAYEADHQERPNRWKTGFRFVLVIPWQILLQYIYPIAIGVIAVIVWFAILFTGRYPKWAWEFMAGFLRFTGRVTGYSSLQTDAWPSFGFGDDPDYPIRVHIGPPQERYSRARVFFRLILGIPAMFIAFLMTYLVMIASVASWFTIVFRGYQPSGIHNVLSVGIAYIVRSTAYFLLMTERLPPVADQPVAPPGLPPPDPATAISAPAPGAAPQQTAGGSEGSAQPPA